MEVRDLIRAHYASGDLANAIINVLAEAGVDTDQLRVQDLVPVDQLHAGGAAATAYVLERIEPTRGGLLLDVGCGIGGPSRMAAATYDAQVTGVDLTPEFVDAATALTARVGLAERASFVATPGESLPFEDRSFDSAMMIHVGMNIPDKRSVFSEVHRVLSPGSVFGVYEQVRRGEGDLTYPLPWADDERSSFVEPLEAYVQGLEAAGFGEVEVEDRTGRSSAGRGRPGSSRRRRSSGQRSPKRWATTGRRRRLASWPACWFSPEPDRPTGTGHVGVVDLQARGPPACHASGLTRSPRSLTPARSARCSERRRRCGRAAAGRSVRRILLGRNAARRLAEGPVRDR
ncbi:MAG: class I SAM-dependent methyltransferase [Geodermatophilaceae bacterium]|nr:class I SAM-dependent methyltransferase [Geodermatophilaceae bacterium]